MQTASSALLAQAGRHTHTHTHTQRVSTKKKTKKKQKKQKKQENKYMLQKKRKKKAFNVRRCTYVPHCIYITMFPSRVRIIIINLLSLILC